MTIRGGGDPIAHMATTPRCRMGPPPRSFAADAHDCIMVAIFMGSTAYKLVARFSRLKANSPRTRRRLPGLQEGAPDHCSLPLCSRPSRAGRFAMACDHP
jgi:hypothetical protein